jgi:hypothetical protein
MAFWKIAVGCMDNDGPIIEAVDPDAAREMFIMDIGVYPCTEDGEIIWEE